MRVVTQAPGRRGLITASLVLLALALIGVVVFVISPWEDSMTPQQANNQVTGFVDSTLSRIAPEYTPVPGTADGGRGLCLSRFGGTADANSLMYVRQIRDFDFDSAHGDQMIEDAERFWRDQGLEIRRDDNTPGVTRISSSADGFGYSLVVNRNGPLISMRGMTPCFSRSELEEAGMA